MRSVFVIVTCLSVMAISCNKKNADTQTPTNDSATPKAKAVAGDSMFPGFDAAAELKALQGTWKVKDNAFGKELATWKIEGKTLTISSGDKTKKGELEIKYPGELAFVQKSNGGESRSYFAFAHSGDDVYIGLGTGGIKRADAYMLADDGVVVFKAGTCKHYKKKMFGGFDKATDIKCELKDEAGKKILSYSLPDSFKKGKFKTASVEILGDVLVNDQMKSSKAQKMQ